MKNVHKQKIRYNNLLFRRKFSDQKRPKSYLLLLEKLLHFLQRMVTVPNQSIKLKQPRWMCHSTVEFQRGGKSNLSLLCSRPSSFRALSYCPDPCRSLRKYLATSRHFSRSSEMPDSAPSAVLMQCSSALPKHGQHFTSMTYADTH